MMKTFRIACLPGDGPGAKLFDGIFHALSHLEKCMGNAFALHFSIHPLGLEPLEHSGSTLPRESLAAIKAADAALIGMIDKRAEQAQSAIGPMRRELMLYADVRPVRPLGGIWALRPDIDLVCIRESTEGFLADRNMHRGAGEMMPSEDVVISMRVLTRKACRRLAVFAFEYARSNNRKKITVVHKANVLRLGCGFFLDTVRETAAEYPDIALDDDLVDNVAHRLIMAPQDYDILLMTNLMGDILSDEASALVSGMTGSANIGEDAAVFFPVSHLVDGETPPEKVNPVPLFLCAGLMLRHLGLRNAAEKFEKGIAGATIASWTATGRGGAFPPVDSFVEALCGALA